MGIGAFIKDNIGVVSLCCGVATIVGGVMTFVFPPTGLFLVLAAAGLSGGVALTVVTGYSWLDKQNEKEPDNLEDTFEDIKALTQNMETSTRKIEELETWQNSEIVMREKLSQDVRKLEDKTHLDAQLTENTIASLKQGQAVLRGRSNATEANVMQLQSQSKKWLYSTNGLFVTPQIPSDSSQQSHVALNQFV